MTPDLCVLGKAFGAGMPISALAGRRALMEHQQQLGSCQMNGAFQAHPTAMPAALEEYSSPGFCERLDAVYADFASVIGRSGVVLRLRRAGLRFGLYFGVADPIREYRKAALKNHDAK